jgi:hypothetical protein
MFFVSASGISARNFTAVSIEVRIALKQVYFSNLYRVLNMPSIFATVLI